MESQPEQIARAFVETWNRHDMAAFAALFAEDADFVNVVGLWWHNRRQIEAAHRDAHATFFRDSQLSGSVAAVKQLKPDVVTLHLRWELRGQYEPDGRTGAPRQGILLLVLVRGDRWLVHAAQNTDILAGALTRPAADSSG